MKDELFEELFASVREGGAILRGDQPASRLFTIQPPEIKDIRVKFWIDTGAVRHAAGNQRTNLAQLGTRAASARRSSSRAFTGSRQASRSAVGCSPRKSGITVRWKLED